MSNYNRYMKIRLANTKYLSDINRVLACAKKTMKNDHNDLQWSDDGYPERIVPLDIKRKQFYVLVDNNEIHACFAFIIGEDPTYLKIDGKWLNNNPYGTIHRIASDGYIKNVFHKVVEYCKSYNVDIRIDTHISNKRMLHLISKEGFSRCGTIQVADGTDREAFQLINTHKIKVS